MWDGMVAATISVSSRDRQALCFSDRGRLTTGHTPRASIRRKRNHVPSAETIGRRNNKFLRYRRDVSPALRPSNNVFSRVRHETHVPLFSPSHHLRPNLVQTQRRTSWSAADWRRGQTTSLATYRRNSDENPKINGQGGDS